MKNRMLVVVLGLFAVLLYAPLVQASGVHVGVLPPPGSSEPLPVSFIWQNGMVMVGTEEFPIQFVIDTGPNHLPWRKVFEIPLEADPGGIGGISPGDHIPVWEHLQILPPPPSLPGPILPWTDWHEKIHDERWTWGGGVDGSDPELIIHLPGDPSPIHVPGHIGDGPDGISEIWFAWPDAVVHPTLIGAPIDVWIHKDLVWQGPPLTASGALFVEVWEWPTVPEPSSFALAGLGFLGLLGLVRRRRAG